MEDPVFPMDTGLFKSNGDVKVVDESHKIAVVKDGSKFVCIMCHSSYWKWYLYFSIYRYFCCNSSKLAMVEL